MEKAKANTSLNLDRAIFRLAGFFILMSLLLSQLHHGFWLLFTAFVGLNMIQASFTGFCPAATLLRKLGLRDGCAFSCSSEGPKT
ncbi:MAG: DUF2892 domain-containing protein [Puniceicoccaceae bacterium]